MMMKLEQHTDLQQLLKQETVNSDTIFLHKHGKGWAAFGNSATLLQQFFTPVWLQMGIVGVQKIPYVIWEGTISPRKSSEVRVFEFSCENLERMTIRCPKPPVSKSQIV